MWFSAFKILNIVVLCCAATAYTAHEGKKFLLAFPPEYMLRTNGICDIIINTDNRAKVTISYHGASHIVNVENSAYTYHIDCAIRAQPGHRENAILVESNVDISVQVYVMRLDSGDMYLALPVKDNGAEYILVSPPSDFKTPRDVTTMYTIAAERDNTTLEIFSPGQNGYELVESITMNSYGTYTNSSRIYFEYTGWKISSNGPISVITGSSYYCLQVEPHSPHAPNVGYISSPAKDDAGHQFIVPKITKKIPGDSGAYVRIISFTQSNVIRLPNQSIHEVINAGEFMDYYIATWDEVTYVDCQDACVVVLFNEWVYPPVVPESGLITYVTPLERRVDYVRFTTVNGTEENPIDDTYLTVISNTTNVTLNGEALTDWRSIPTWLFYDLAVEIDRDTSYTLESTDGGRFIAFVYGYTGHRGYGSEIVHGDSEYPTETTTNTTFFLP